MTPQGPSEIDTQELRGSLGCAELGFQVKDT